MSASFVLIVVLVLVLVLLLLLHVVVVAVLVLVLVAVGCFPVSGIRTPAPTGVRRTRFASGSEGCRSTP